MNFDDKVNLITEKIVERLLIVENMEQSARPGHGMNARYIYHCANQKDLPSIFKFGFERFYFGKGVGEMYGSGIYCTTDLQSSIVNSYRGLYGPVIVRAEVKSYKNCLIWEEIIAKEVYGGKWRMEDQLQMMVPEFINQMKQLRVTGDFNDGSRNVYEFIVKRRERSSVGARQLYLQRNNFQNGGPYEKVRGFVFFGSVDGHTAVLKDAKNAMPLEYSVDHGKTWKYARTEETLRYTKDDFDSELDFGNKYAKTNPVEYGYSRVLDKQGKTNYINKDGDEISQVWLDGGSDFNKVGGGEPVAEIIYNGIKFYLTTDGMVYQELEDDYPLCSLDELPEQF